MTEATRCCLNCKVKWIHSGLKDRNCPVCSAGSFFTLNISDMGFSMAADLKGIDVSSFRFVQINDISETSKNQLG